MAVVALPATPAGPGPAAAADCPQVQLDFEQYTLPNGLRVTLREDHRLPIAAVNLWYHVGAQDEEPGRTGFAHLFEHMMFQASAHIPPDQYFPILESAGATLINASTDNDRTNYLEDIPSNQLELALWAESDRMATLLDRLDASMLARQQEVVRNERRQRVENSPYGLAEEAVYHQLFPSEHPFHANIIGSHEDLQAARIDDVRDFFRRYYAPNNASLAIVGDIDIPRTKALVERYFASIPRGPEVTRRTVATPPVRMERRVTVTDQVELPRIYMAWLTDPVYSAGDATADIAAAILGGGKSGRLFRSLVYERKVAQSVSAYQESYGAVSIFQVSGTARPGHTIDEVEAAIEEELRRLADGGPTLDEVEAARNSIWTERVSELERAGGFGGVADRFNRYDHFFGTPDGFAQDLARYSAVTAADVQRHCRETLGRDRRVTVLGVPGEKVVAPGPPSPATPPAAETEFADREPWRGRRPDAGEISPVGLPPVRRFELPNGLPVYLLESHRLPLVGAAVIFRAGSALDPPGLEGLANLTFAMLDEGAGRRDALEIAAEVRRLGGTLFAGADVERGIVGCRGLKQNTRSLFGIMTDLVLAPAFPEDELERVRSRGLVTLRQTKDSPYETGRRRISACVYGPDHPYGHPVDGTEASLQRITRDDLLSYYREHVGPAEAALFLVGDMTEQEARQLAGDHLGRWRGGPARAPAYVVPRPAESRITLIDKPAATQTMILAGLTCPPRTSPDYERFELANAIYSGLFSSRLNMNLREDKGYTYGAESSIQPRRGPSTFLVATSVQADATGASVREILGELEGMRAGVTADEVHKAGESLARGLPARFETTFQALDGLADLFVYGLPRDYYAQYPGRVSGAPPEEVRKLATRYLDPGRIRFVLVGDRARILPQLREQGLDGVVQLTPEGQTVPDGM